MSMEAREGLIRAMRQAAVENAEKLARMAHEETGYGKVPDKIRKILLAANKTPGTEDIVPAFLRGTVDDAGGTDALWCYRFYYAFHQSAVDDYQ